jgi:signal peptidase I
VIVFKSPTHPDDFYLKRIVGLPGERVKVVENKVIIYNTDYPQGMVLSEEYLDTGMDTQGTKSYVLAENQYFVMGDNRTASYDSRNFGPIDYSSIVGRTFFRGYPLTRLQLFQNPDYNL